MLASYTIFWLADIQIFYLISLIFIHLIFAELPHQTLEERVEMNNDSEGEKQLATQRTPRVVTSFNGTRDSSHNSHHVQDNEGGWWYEKRSPFEEVEFAKLGIHCRF